MIPSNARCHCADFASWHVEVAIFPGVIAVDAAVARRGTLGNPSAWGTFLSCFRRRQATKMASEKSEQPAQARWQAPQSYTMSPKIGALSGSPLATNCTKRPCGQWTRWSRALEAPHTKGAISSCVCACVRAWAPAERIRTQGFTDVVVTFRCRVTSRTRRQPVMILYILEHVVYGLRPMGVMLISWNRSYGN